MFRRALREDLPRARRCVHRSHPVNEHDDERTLSIFANGAYYLSRARLREIGVVFLGVHQARGGVDVPSPEKHR